MNATYTCQRRCAGLTSHRQRDQRGRPETQRGQGNRRENTHRESPLSPAAVITRPHVNYVGKCFQHYTIGSTDRRPTTKVPEGNRIPSTARPPLAQRATATAAAITATRPVSASRELCSKAAPRNGDTYSHRAAASAD
ncbi:hypothetical protein GCM10018954_098140 [Kutzneria kofuensis]